MKKLLSVVLTVWTAVGAGCGSGQKVVEADGPVGELGAVNGGLEAGQAYPVQEGTAVAGGDHATKYRVSGGKDSGKVMVVERSREGEVLIERWTIEGEKQPRFDRVLSEEADGSLVMREQRSYDRNVRSVFVPPLMVFPAKLEGDAAFTMSSKMTVHPLDKPKSIKEQGMARVEISLRGTQAHRKGAEASTVVRTVFTADLKSADVVRTTDRWFAPGAGMVREAYEETVKVFGVLVERSAEVFAATE